MKRGRSRVSRVTKAYVEDSSSESDDEASVLPNYATSSKSRNDEPPTEATNKQSVSAILLLLGVDVNKLGDVTNFPRNGYSPKALLVKRNRERAGSLLSLIFKLISERICPADPNVCSELLRMKSTGAASTIMTSSTANGIRKRLQACNERLKETVVHLSLRGHSNVSRMASSLLAGIYFRDEVNHFLVKGMYGSELGVPKGRRLMGKSRFATGRRVYSSLDDGSELPTLRAYSFRVNPLALKSGFKYLTNRLDYRPGLV
jgi:hypothetical protein